MKDHLFTDESLDLRGRTVRLRYGTVVTIPKDAIRERCDCPHIIYRWGGIAFQDLPGSSSQSIYDVIETLPSSPSKNRKHLYTDESLDLRGYTVRLRGQEGGDVPIVTIPKSATRKMNCGWPYITYQWGDNAVAFQDRLRSVGINPRDVVEILSPPSEPEEQDDVLRLRPDRDRDLRGRTVLLRGDGALAIVTIPEDAERGERPRFITYSWPGGVGGLSREVFQDIAGMGEGSEVDENDIIAVLEAAPESAQAERDRSAQEAALARDAALSLAAGVRLLNQPSLVTLGGLMALDAKLLERLASCLGAEAEKL